MRRTDEPPQPAPTRPVTTTWTRRLSRAGAQAGEPLARTVGEALDDDLTPGDDA